MLTLGVDCILLHLQLTVLAGAAFHLDPRPPMRQNLKE